MRMDDIVAQCPGVLAIHDDMCSSTESMTGTMTQTS